MVVSSISHHHWLLAVTRHANDMDHYLSALAVFLAVQIMWFH